jgi:porphobilinogen synthase
VGEHGSFLASAHDGPSDKARMDRDRVIMETLTAIRRAGVGIILTYWATEAARRLR